MFKFSKLISVFILSLGFYSACFAETSNNLSYSLTVNDVSGPPKQTSEQFCETICNRGEIKKTRDIMNGCSVFCQTCAPSSQCPDNCPLYTSEGKKRIQKVIDCINGNKF